MSQQYKVKIQNCSAIFDILKIEYPSMGRIIFTGINNEIIKEVIKKRAIDEAKINSVTTMKQNGIVEVEVKYTKLNIVDIISKKSRKEQITEVLSQLGYSGKKIKELEYEKGIWYVTILNEELDNAYKIHCYETSLTRDITKLLGYAVNISIY